MDKEIKGLIEVYELNCSIEEFKDKVNWDYISYYQNLSEEFIEKFKDKVDWYYISCNQNLSEEFIEKFKDKVDWYYISCYQNLSEEFIEKFKVNADVYKAIWEKKTLQQKSKEMVEYAKKWGLKIKDDCLYAYREHDKWGRGQFNKTIFYEVGKYYRDWHCDMRKDEENSFGLGIFPKGNTLVRVSVKDWGVAVDRGDGKARVWGFRVEKNLTKW